MDTSSVGAACPNHVSKKTVDRERTLQLELLDRRSWTTRAELASAIFEWIEGWYNPRRRHTSIGDLSPVEYERRPAAAGGSSMMSTRELSGEPGQAPNVSTI